ncbi:hypothetical protein G6F41_007655 [Rhizopus arrhizus]|nr:hypothetical protein G6F41_007655 [Rhizopus arrhizus]
MKFQFIGLGLATALVVSVIADTSAAHNTHAISGNTALISRRDGMAVPKRLASATLRRRITEDQGKESEVKEDEEEIDENEVEEEEADENEVEEEEEEADENEVEEEEEEADENEVEKDEKDWKTARRRSIQEGVVLRRKEKDEEEEDEEEVDEEEVDEEEKDEEEKDEEEKD